MPGSPTTISSEPSPDRAVSKAVWSRRSSDSRPTKVRR